MSEVESRVEFRVKEEEQPVMVVPSVIELPVAEEEKEGEGRGLSAPVKEAVLAWLGQRGAYQREDVSLSDRLEIARRFWEKEREWGEVSRLAEEYKLSRVTIYAIGSRLAPFFQPRRPGPVAGLKELLAEDEPVTTEEGRGMPWTKEERERLRGRLILTGLFPGGVPMRPLEEILAEVPGVGVSDSTIWRITDRDGIKAAEVLHTIDFAGVSEKGVIPVIDETFFDDRPIFFAIEAGSLSIYDFYVPEDGKRTAEDWALFLLTLKERGLNIIGGMGDGATAYPKAFEMLLEEEKTFREDHFHTQRDVQRLRRKLENSAYRAFGREYKKAAKYDKEGTDEAHQKLMQAQAESLRLAEAHDAYAEYATWVDDGLQIVDLTSGEIRDPQTNAWLLDEAIAAMAQVNHDQVLKMSQRLANHKPSLLLYLNDLHPGRPLLKTSLETYLQDPPLAQVVWRAVARHWRLQHEVQSNQRPHFRPAMAQAQLDLALWIAGDPFLEQWAQDLHSLLDAVLKTSSAVENINSIFKPLVNRKKHFANAVHAHNFVALFVLWHNMRVFKEGLRRGQSPFEILGIDLGQKDWRTLLGYPPLP